MEKDVLMDKALGSVGGGGQIVDDSRVKLLHTLPFLVSPPLTPDTVTLL